MNYYEYLFVVLLFLGLTTLLAIGYGWQTVAASTAFSLVGLLMVAIRLENTYPDVSKSQQLGIKFKWPARP